MKNESKIKLYAFTIDCKDTQALAKFYAELLNWETAYAGEEYTVICPPGAKRGAYPGLTFQQNPGYVPPVWPEEPDAQQQMAHLDFVVTDLDAAVRHAVACGATVSPQQFSDGWTVMFDPVGHPFCLCKMEGEIEW